jgi:uncharacterized protein YecE (DUF72 family)
MILVGTNGFQHRDWVPVFYPRALSPDAWLQHYSRHFACCELGFTYYRIPEDITIKQLADFSGGSLQFTFRVPSRLSEEHAEHEDLARRFVSALWPLKESGQMAGVVAQFAPEFAFIRDNFERLCRLRDSLAGIQLIAEFGCPDWMTPKAVRHLARERIALACVDGGTGLRERTAYYATAGLAYVRFQGRRQAQWIKGDGSAQHDYLYSRAELAAAVPEIRRLERESERVLVLMNNPWRGQAAINAGMLKELLSAL